MSLGVALVCPLGWHMQRDPQLEKTKTKQPQSHIIEPIPVFSFPLETLGMRHFHQKKKKKSGNGARNGIQDLGNTWEQLSWDCPAGRIYGVVWAPGLEWDKEKIPGNGGIQMGAGGWNKKVDLLCKKLLIIAFYL